MSKSIITSVDKSGDTANSGFAVDFRSGDYVFPVAVKMKIKKIRAFNISTIQFREETSSSLINIPVNTDGVDVSLENYLGKQLVFSAVNGGDYCSAYFFIENLD